MGYIDGSFQYTWVRERLPTDGRLTIRRNGYSDPLKIVVNCESMSKVELFSAAQKSSAPSVVQSLLYARAHMAHF